MEPIKSISEYKLAFPDSVEGNNQSKRGMALELAWKIRNFEIELYWKRAAYFWTFIAAAFVAFGVMASAKFHSETVRSELLVLFGCLGVVFSFSWFRVNKGSKFWQENWETHIDLLEDEVLGPLYKTVLMKKTSPWYRGMTSSRAISVSKVNSLVSVFVTLFWGFLVAMNLGISAKQPIDLWKVASVAMTVVFCILIYLIKSDDLENPSHLVGTELRVKSRPL
ncbi:MAG: hypothetical protein ABSE27_04440 [Acidobacteriaceae bacterium]